jgi:hypothetical protein
MGLLKRSSDLILWKGIVFSVALRRQWTALWLWIGFSCLCLPVCLNAMTCIGIFLELYIPVSPPGTGPETFFYQ